MKRVKGTASQRPIEIVQDEPHQTSHPCTKARPAMHANVFFDTVIPFLIVDNRGHIQDANPAAIQLLGPINTGEYGSTISDYLDDRSKLELMHALQNAAVHHNKSGHRLMLNKNDEKFEVQIDLGPISRFKSGSAFTQFGGSFILSICTINPSTQADDHEILLSRQQRNERQKNADHTELAQQALNSSERRFYEIFENAATGIAITDKAGYFNEFNPALCKMLGYDSAALVAGNLFRLIYHEDLPAYTRQLSRLLNKESTVFDIEIRYSKSDNRQIWVQKYVSALYDASGQICNLVHLVTDISSRKQIEQALQASQDRLQCIVETAAEAIITIDHEGTIKSLNQAAISMFGFSLEEALEQNVAILMPAPHRQQHQSYIQNYLESGLAKIIGAGRDVFGQRKDGSLFPAHIAISEVKHLGIFTALIQDISEQKLEEQKLKCSERRYRSLFEESALCLLEEDWSKVLEHARQIEQNGITDLHLYFEENRQQALECLRLREIKQINKAALKLFEARNEEQLLSSFNGHMVADGWEDPAGIMAALLEGHSEFTAETSLKTLSGEVIPVLFHFAASAGHENTLERVVCTIIDIRERKHAEELQHILMAELDHRVKNILTTALSIAKQTLRRSPSLEYFQEAFTGRLTALADVHQLLNAQKWTGVSLSELVRAATRPYVQDQGPLVEVRGESVILSNKSAQAIYMILHELSTNAAKYGGLSQAEGQLLVSWKVQQTEQGTDLYFDWKEQGHKHLEKPVHSGFGRQLIERTVSYELRGSCSFDYRDKGLHFSFQIPLQHRAAGIRQNPIITSASDTPDTLARESDYASH